MSQHEYWFSRRIDRRETAESLSSNKQSWQTLDPALTSFSHDNLPMQLKKPKPKPNQRSRRNTYIPKLIEVKTDDFIFKRNLEFICHRGPVALLMRRSATE